MIVTRTPLRVTFFGSSTDKPSFYRNDEDRYGAGLNAAIDKYVYVFINPRQTDEDLRVLSGSLKPELVETSTQLRRHIITKGALEFFGLEHGLEIANMSDLANQAQKGSGLGQSSALTVGLVNGLYFHGYGIRAEESPEMLARAATDIERIRAGMDGGKQDQYASALGSMHAYRFNPDMSVDVLSNHAGEAEMLKAIRENLLLFFTGRGRAHNGKNGQTSASATISPQERMAKMLEMRDIALRMFDQYRDGNYGNTGRALDRSWWLKRTADPDTTNQRTDAIYSAAIKAGSEGGKSIGAGGGGYMLFWTRPLYQSAVTERMLRLGLKKINFQFERQGSKIVYADRQPHPLAGMPLPEIRSF